MDYQKRLARAMILPLISAVGLLAAGAPASAQQLLPVDWQNFYQGANQGGGALDWAHVMALDSLRQRIYFAGKLADDSRNSSSTNRWAYSCGLRKCELPTPIANASVPGRKNTPGLSEEMLAGISIGRVGALAVAGRYASGTSTWCAQRSVFDMTTSAISPTSHDLPGSMTRGGWSPPLRGLGSVIEAATGNAWILSLSSSPTTSMYYSFAEFDPSGTLLRDFQFPIATKIARDWTGDCCYDPPSRMASDGKGNIYALLGSRYTAAQGYGFVLGSFNSITGSLGVSSHFGTAVNTSSNTTMAVADAVVVSTTTGNAFILAKTNETTGFATRILHSDFSLLVSPPSFLDAALAMSPGGDLWVVESATGRGMAYDAKTGNAGLQESLKFPDPAVGAADAANTVNGASYIGQLLVDSGAFYVSGGSNSQAWVAKYDFPKAAVPPTPCVAYSYPNPFNSNRSHTTIHYEMPADSAVTIKIYDMVGRPIQSWNFSAGETGGRAGINELSWDGSGSGRKVGTGMYFANLKASACKQVLQIGVQH